MTYGLRCQLQAEVSRTQHTYLHHLRFLHHLVEYPGLFFLLLHLNLDLLGELSGVRHDGWSERSDVKLDQSVGAIVEYKESAVSSSLYIVMIRETRR